MNSSFITVLSNFGEPTCIVYHDRDINSDGTNKKPHYHVLVMCRNRRSENVIEKLVRNCGGANGKYEIVQSKCAYARYLCHMDNPEKMSYSPDEVMTLCGADYSELALTKSDRSCAKIDKMREILRYCREHNEIYYCDLLEYCMDSRLDWLPCMVGTYGRTIRNYLQSREYKIRMEK